MSCEPILTIDELILARNEEDAVVMGGANGELACTFPRVDFCIYCLTIFSRVTLKDKRFTYAKRVLK